MLLPAQVASAGVLELRGYVYAITNPVQEGLVKIGKSSDPYRRASELFGTGNARPHEVVLALEVADMDFAEAELHRKFSDKREHPRREWFRVTIEEVREAFEILGDISSETPLGNNERRGPWHVFQDFKKNEPEAYAAQIREERDIALALLKEPAAIAVYQNDDDRFHLMICEGDSWREFDVGYAGLIGVFDCGSYGNAETILDLVKGYQGKISLEEIRSICFLMKDRPIN